MAGKRAAAASGAGAPAVPAGVKVETRNDGAVVVSVPDVPGFWRAEGPASLAFGLLVSSYLLWPLAFVALLYALPAKVRVVAVALYATTFFDGSERRTGRPSRAVRLSTWWQNSWRYLDMKMVRTVPLEPNKQYIFGWSPHGILLLSRISYYAGIFETLFPGVECRVLAASPMFYVPFVRDICLALNAVDASRRSAMNVLKAGLSLMLYPGGSREIFTTDATKPDQLYLSGRKGFIALALTHGCDLVPTYVFNEKNSYKRKLVPPAVRTWFLQHLKIPLIVFYGRFLTLLPFRQRNGLLIVVGAPLPVERMDSPTQEQIDALHAKYVAAVRELYNKWREEAGCGTEDVIIT